jgi:hypothetical protein
MSRVCPPRGCFGSLGGGARGVGRMHVHLHVGLRGGAEGVGRVRVGLGGLLLCVGCRAHDKLYSLPCVADKTHEKYLFVMRFLIGHTKQHGKLFFYNFKKS